MDDFPEFIRKPVNRISSASQYTKDIEGYLFDGADGSQAALWKAHEDRLSKEHAHDFDEYIAVLQGTCTLILEGREIPLFAGQEYLVPKGTRQSMKVSAGTRTLHVFGGRRAQRERGA